MVLTPKCRQVHLSPDQASGDSASITSMRKNLLRCADKCKTSSRVLPEAGLFPYIFLIMTTSYKYRYNAQSAMCSFYLLLEYKRIKRAEVSFHLYKEDCIYLKKKYGISLDFTYSFTLSLHGKSIFKTMVSLQMLKEEIPVHC